MQPGSRSGSVQPGGSVLTGGVPGGSADSKVVVMDGPDGHAAIPLTARRLCLPPPVWPACSRATTALLLRAQLASRHQRHQRLRNLQLELESLAVERAASTSLRGELLVLGAGCVWGGGGT
jgi:hypothetical protein